MFNQYLKELTSICLDSAYTDEDLVKIQRIQSDILNNYTAGKLSDLEKRTLYNVTFIMMRDIRNALRGDSE